MKNLRGERHPNARLTNAQVREIRKVWHQWEKQHSSKGYGAIADLFGISQWTARDLVTYRTRIDA